MKPWQHQGAVVLFYTVLTLLMTLPAVFQLSSHVVGSGGDPWQSMWRLEHKASLLAMVLPGSGSFSWSTFREFVYEEFLGGGQPRLVNLSAWPWLPLHVLFGEPAAYNLIWLASFVLSGYCMYRLVHYVARQLPEAIPFSREAAAVVAGIMYMFLPYHVAHALGHFGAMQTQWIPLVILLALRWYKQPTLGRTIALVVVVTIQAWTEHHYLLWLGIAGFVVGLPRWRLLVIALKQASRVSVVVLVVGIVFGVVLPYLPTLRASQLPETPLELGVDQTTRFSADLFSYIVPAVFHPWWGEAAHVAFSESFTGNISEATQFIGFMPLLLVVFFYRLLPPRIAKGWMVLAGIFFVMSLGPWLHIFGRLTGIPLPYNAVDSLPIFSAIRTIARAGVMVGVAWTVLFGCIVAMNVRRPLNFGLLTILLLLEFLFMPVPLQSASLSPVYAQLSKLGGHSVIEIPAATNYVTASRALYVSTIHGQQVLGNIALERGQDPEELRVAKTLPGIRQLLYVRTTELKEDREEFFGQNVAESLLDSLQSVDSRAILIHTDSLSPQQVSALRDFLEVKLELVPQSFDDVILYDARSSPRGHDGVVIARGTGWEHVGFDPARQSTFGEISRQATLKVTNTNAQPQTLVFSLTLPEESSGALQVRASDRIVFDTTERKGQVTFRFPVPPGTIELDFINKLPGKLIIQNPDFEVDARMPQ